jgi:hypothetical protein
LDWLSGGRLVLGVGLGSESGLQVEWGAFNEETDLGRRAKMLDEALDIIVGLWSGRPYSFCGSHFQLSTTQFLPQAVQQPRIPIWSAMVSPTQGPIARAAKWDGIVPLFGKPVREDFTMLSELLSQLRHFRGTLEQFDVVYIAPPIREYGIAQPSELLEQYMDSGVTWWLQRIVPTDFGGSWEADWPVHAMEDAVRRGPPRVGPASNP